MTENTEQASAETRTVVLIGDIKGLGKAGELARIPPARAEALTAAGKVRAATIDDFPAIKR